MSEIHEFMLLWFAGRSGCERQRRNVEASTRPEDAPVVAELFTCSDTTAISGREISLLVFPRWDSDLTGRSEEQAWSGAQVLVPGSQGHMAGASRVMIGGAQW